MFFYLLIISSQVFVIVAVKCLMKRSINLSLYSPDLNRLGIDELEKVMKKLQKV